MEKILSGEYEIFDAGLVISFKNEPIVFQLTSDLKVSISFSDDTEKKEQRIEPNPINNKELEIRLINFNNSLGTGTTEPLSIGTINNRTLLLNFIVYTLGAKTQKTFQYTWYLGKEVNNA